MPLAINGTIDTITLVSGNTYEVDRAFPFGQVDSTSTSTVFTATVPGVYTLRDGVCVYLKNGVITSASGFTLNINGLGEKPVYQTMAAASQVTTAFNVNYTMLFVYNSTRISGGCWDMFYGYNSNENTIGYNIRNNAAITKMAEALTRYKIVFTKMDGTLLPCTATSNSTATTKTLTTTAFNPHGEIYYYSTTTGVAVDASPGASYMWVRYSGADLRYAFNKGTTLIAMAPIYIRCVPQSDGSVKLDGNDCIVQALPSTEDNKVYIYLGNPYDTYRIVLSESHPIYEYKNGAIRQWTNTPIADYTNYGLVKVRQSGGLMYDPTDNDIRINAASSATTKGGVAVNYPLTPGHQHEAAFYGLAKAAGADMASSSNPVGTYTSEAKSAIKTMLDISDSSLPTVTSSDNGKVLRVVNGAWAAASLLSANGVSF